MQADNSMEVGLLEKVQIIDGIKAQIVVHQRKLKHLATNQKAESTEIADISKKLKDLEQELKTYQAIQPLPTTFYEEGTKEPLVYYSEYLMLDRLLNSQHPLSGLKGPAVHDETLFIVVHQAYELWFKQILHEVNGVIDLMSKDFVAAEDLGRIINQLNRVKAIQSLLIQQVNIMETMSSMDFMDFRDFLFPASGFQSFQFRLLENKLGLSTEKRQLHQQKAYHTTLAEEHQRLVQESEKGPTLFNAIEKWLERFPFFTVQEFNFLEEYKKAVANMLAKDKQIVMRDTSKDTSSENPMRTREMETLHIADERFKSLFDEDHHKTMRAEGKCRLSFRATQAAMLILAYENEPLLYAPSRLLNILIDIDENLGEWRFKHMMMTQRMIGARVGTGGSSGYLYLKSTLERSKIFTDIANMATFLIPRAVLPKLPHNLKINMGFYHEVFDAEQHAMLKNSPTEHKKK